MFYSRHEEAGGSDYDEQLIDYTEDDLILDDDDVINTSRIWERQVQIATSRASEFFWSFFKDIFGTIIPSFQQAQIWNLRIKHEFSLFAY